jgi:hypothetical protein
VKRTLVVCDTFEGLPAPSDKDRSHQLTDGRVKGYAAGDYRGAQEEVVANVTKWGAVESCRFLKGLFSDTLPKLDAAPAVIFMDVDLIDSARDAFRHVWTKLADGSRFFTHEATSVDFVRGILEPAWWHEVVKSCPPVLIGAGFGFGPHARNLAILVKAGS